MSPKDSHRLAVQSYEEGEARKSNKGSNMTQQLARKSATFSGEARSLASDPPWYRLALAVVLILSAFLNLYDLTGEGYSNNYYSSAVKNMLTSWSNFFFVSYDAGFVSVDKPPLGLWIQAASARLLGFSGLSLLLPQALAGILSVALVYHLVRRTFRPVAGLLSALVLALTPIIVATSRNNDGYARGPVRARGSVGFYRRRREGEPGPAAFGRNRNRSWLQRKDAASLFGTARLLPFVPARRPHDLAAAVFAPRPRDGRAARRVALLGDRGRSNANRAASLRGWQRERLGA